MSIEREFGSRLFRAILSFSLVQCGGSTDELPPHRRAPEPPLTAEELELADAQCSYLERCDPDALHLFASGAPAPNLRTALESPANCSVTVASGVSTNTARISPFATSAPGVTSAVNAIQASASGTSARTATTGSAVLTSATNVESAPLRRPWPSANERTEAFEAPSAALLRFVPGPIAAMPRAFARSVVSSPR